MRLVEAALGEHAQRLVQLGALFPVIVDECVECGVPDEGQQALVFNLVEQRIIHVVGEKEDFLIRAHLLGQL